MPLYKKVMSNIRAHLFLISVMLCMGYGLYYIHTQNDMRIPRYNALSFEMPEEGLQIRKHDVHRTLCRDRETTHIRCDDCVMTLPIGPHSGSLTETAHNLQVITPDSDASIRMLWTTIGQFSYKPLQFYTPVASVIRYRPLSLAPPLLEGWVQDLNIHFTKEGPTWHFKESQITAHSE